jgi:hypothetical protein
MRRVKKITERKRATMSQMRFGRPNVRWFSRDGGLSAEERMADGGSPGVGGAMKAELFAVRRCMSGEGSDFEGGKNCEGGGLGLGEEDMTVVACSREQLLGGQNNAAASTALVLSLSLQRPRPCSQRGYTVVYPHRSQSSSVSSLALSSQGSSPRITLAIPPHGAAADTRLYTTHPAHQPLARHLPPSNNDGAF